MANKAPQRQQHYTNSSCSSVYGIGTARYGKGDKREDGSYIATKWVVVLMIPIYPIASFRIKDLSPAGFKSASKHSSERVALNTPQIAKTYAVSIAILAVLIIGVSNR